MSLSKRLMRVLGRRTFRSFVLVTFLTAALLTSVNMASRHALENYVDEQLALTPWDFTVFRQGGSVPQDENVMEKIRAVDGVDRVAMLAVLRAKLTKHISDTVIDGKSLQTPWLTLIAASDPELLPPQLLSIRQHGRQEKTKPILGLVGPDRVMGDAYRALQGSRNFSVKVKTPDMEEAIFRTSLAGVIRLDRDRLSRWLMDQMGAPVYVPPVGAVLLMPYQAETDAESLRDFDSLARGIIPADIRSPDSAIAQGRDPLHEQSAEYIPEVNYLVRMDRENLSGGWDIDDSLGRVIALGNRILEALSATRSVSTEPTKPVHSASRSTSDKPVLQMQDMTVLASVFPAGAFAVKNVYPNKPERTSVGMEGLIPVHGPDDPPGHHGVKVFDYRLDSTTRVLLEQIQETARSIGIVTLLIAIPLLWVGWMLASHIAGLLILNERRNLGLMRLRGVPGERLGRTLQRAVISGGLCGGIAGIVFASLALLFLYEGSNPPLDVLQQPRQGILLILFLIITVLLSLMVSTRLIRYATTVSPLEASGRFAGSEPGVARVRFGATQAAALVLGGAVLLVWVFDASTIAWISSEWIRNIAVIVDFLALPLFLYGMITLLASRRAWMEALMMPFQKVLGGRLALLTRRHMAAKPHRSVAFMMIVALIASISIYPTIASVSFEEKAERGTRVQLGGDWHFTFNAPDLARSSDLRGSVKGQLTNLDTPMREILNKAERIQGVESAHYMVEAFLPSFYMPGSGLNGVPLYLLHDAAEFKNHPYAEEGLGIDAPYREILQRVQDGGVAVSPAVAEFWEPQVDVPLRLGVDGDSHTLSAPVAGVLGQLPGMPPRTITSREGYIQSRIDYLNYLYDRAAYIVADAGNTQLQDLQVFIPRTIFTINVASHVLAQPHERARVQSELAAIFPTTPLEMHTLPEETRETGGSMFVSLAVENMKIYLGGGILLALIAIMAVALANYAEDRRTLGLLRIRGTSPRLLQRFTAALLVSPALIGLALGGVAAVVAGYGLTNRVWAIRDIRTGMELLETHWLVPGLSLVIAGILIALVFAAAWTLSVWTFRKSAAAMLQSD